MQVSLKKLVLKFENNTNSCNMLKQLENTCHQDDGRYQKKIFGSGNPKRI